MEFLNKNNELRIGYMNINGIISKIVVSCLNIDKDVNRINEIGPGFRSSTLKFRYEICGQ